MSAEEALDRLLKCDRLGAPIKTTVGQRARALGTWRAQAWGRASEAASEKQENLVVTILW